MELETTDFVVDRFQDDRNGDKSFVPALSKFTLAISSKSHCLTKIATTMKISPNCPGCD